MRAECSRIRGGRGGWRSGDPALRLLAATLPRPDHRRGRAAVERPKGRPPGPRTVLHLGDRRRRGCFGRRSREPERNDRLPGLRRAPRRRPQNRAGLRGICPGLVRQRAGVGTDGRHPGGTRRLSHGLGRSSRENLPDPVRRSVGGRLSRRMPDRARQGGCGCWN